LVNSFISQFYLDVGGAKTNQRSPDGIVWEIDVGNKVHVQHWNEFGYWERPISAG
jgi:hypothetical protein